MVVEEGVKTSGGRGDCVRRVFFLDKYLSWMSPIPSVSFANGDISKEP